MSRSIPPRPSAAPSPGGAHAGAVPASEPWADEDRIRSLSSAQVRALLGVLYPVIADFDAFCLDRYPATFHAFASGMNRAERVNLLLSQNAPGDVALELYKSDGDAFVRACARIVKADPESGVERVPRRRFSVALFLAGAAALGALALFLILRRAPEHGPPGTRPQAWDAAVDQRALVGARAGGTVGLVPTDLLRSADPDAPDAPDAPDHRARQPTGPSAKGSASRHPPAAVRGGQPVAAPVAPEEHPEPAAFPVRISVLCRAQDRVSLKHGSSLIEQADAAQPQEQIGGQAMPDLPRVVFRRELAPGPYLIECEQRPPRAPSRVVRSLTVRPGEDRYEAKCSW